MTTNYEKIKNMTAEEMTKTIYLKFIKEITHIFLCNTNINFNDVNFGRLGCNFFYEWLLSEDE